MILNTETVEVLKKAIKEHNESRIRAVVAIEFKNWCDAHAWEEDYREQKTHTTGELFNIWNGRFSITDNVSIDETTISTKLI